MDDMISRQKAINVIEKMRAYIGHNMERAVGAAFIEILDDVGEDIGRLPSIQLATGTNVGTKLGTDCISRKAAIEVVQNRHMMLSKEKVLLINDLEKLPSAQLATDTNVGNKAQLYDKDTTFENGGEIKRWSEDIISRQAVMRAIDEALIGKGCSADGTTMAKLINEYVIKKVPSTEPKRIRAKWIATTSLQEGQITWRDYKCSNCSHHREKPMNFCEVCGAKMER